LILPEQASESSKVAADENLSRGSLSLWWILQDKGDIEQSDFSEGDMDDEIPDSTNAQNEVPKILLHIPLTGPTFSTHVPGQVGGDMTFSTHVENGGDMGRKWVENGGDMTFPGT
jgi:hypothetical protein